eukprot:TRINITY_DN7557_c0_g1_i1.p1 TRINITY_DN7557_c0_g1~~TRINITY_DN7557_c0_g1_i1.p1  ORF type:complete len:607 (+),score=102.61 TRINITY_DN7557_c0_g1_i1:86-1906(+)
MIGLIVTLLSFVACTLSHPSDLIPYPEYPNASSCLEVSLNQCIEISHPPSCDIIDGVISNQSCFETHSDLMGYCCLGNGHCMWMTNLACNLAEGRWTKKTGVDGSDSCDSYCQDQFFGSCCVGYECIDGIDQANCTNMGGNFSDHSCRAATCFNYGVNPGACCTKSGEFCYENISPAFCGENSYPTFFYHHPGSTCEEACPGYNTMAYPPPPVTNNSNGRCCSSSKCVLADSSDDCDSSYYYQEGYSCGDDSLGCNDIVACTIVTDCINTYRPFCIASGGMYSYGRCDRDIYFTAACWITDEWCQYGSKTLCDSVGGNFTDEGSCPKIEGACCLPSGECEIVSKSVNCDYTSNFIKDGNCSAEECAAAAVYTKCCFDGFCTQTDYSENTCSIADEYSNTEVLDVCPNTGTCSGEDLTIEETDIVLSHNYIISSVAVTLKDSSIISQDLTIDSGQLNIIGSNFTSDELILTGGSMEIFESHVELKRFNVSSSTISIHSGSKIVVAGCVAINSVTLNISNLDEIELDTEVVLVQYDCESTIPDITVATNNFGVCTELTATNKLISVFFTNCADQETETEEEYEPEEGSDVISRFPPILWATALLMILL